MLADRYIYTAFARDFVRSNDRKWIRDVFGFALVPDLVCYLRIDVETLALRVIETKAMNYWESSMDLRLGNDLYDSFKKYQSLLIEEFDKMAVEFNFEVVDALRLLKTSKTSCGRRSNNCSPRKGSRGRRPSSKCAALARSASRLQLRLLLSQRSQLPRFHPPPQHSPADLGLFRQLDQAGAGLLEETPTTAFPQA